MTRAKIFFFPDYSKSNPYQTLLYDHFSSELYATPGTLEEAIKFFAAHQNGPNAPRVIFHLHWEDALYKFFKDWDQALKYVNQFFQNLKAFKKAGGVLVWTCHNLGSHEPIAPDLDAQIRQSIAKMADLIIVHSESSALQVGEQLPAARGKFLVMPHGNYAPVYDMYVTPEQGRQRYGLPPDSRVFIHFGQMRKYKGIEGLLGAFSTLAPHYPQARLILAGKPCYPIKADIPRAVLEGQVIQRLDFIPDEEIPYLFRAADFGVFPFHKILATGSVTLALTFGIPCLAPRIGAIPELITDGESGFLDDQLDGNRLVGRMKQVLEMDSKALERMKTAAGKEGSKLDWNRLSASVENAIMKLIDQPVVHNSQRADNA